MRFDVLTLFPEVFDSPLKASIMGRAIETGAVQIRLHQIRDWTDDKHRVVDDAPYGGGGGMVMKAGPVVEAIRAVKKELAESPDQGRGEAPSDSAADQAPVIYMSPQGERLDNKLADELAALPGLILLCGNYEGIDERAIELEVDREISIGDYVLTGGEYAALILMNAVIRKVPGVLGNAASAPNDSFEQGLLDFPHYTRPEVFEGLSVPEVLLSGDHGKVDAWRREQSVVRTAKRRPDLIDSADLTPQEREQARKARRNTEDPGA